MSTQTINFTPMLYHYFQQVSLREPEVLQQLRQQTQKMSMSQMQISPEQGQFLFLLMKLMNAKKTLDIGVFTGYSALSVALALPENAKVVACDKNAEWTKLAKKYWESANVSHKIELKLGPTIDTLKGLIESGEAESFDFAFIDADKLNYENYYDAAITLLRSGGLIAVDNVLWGGAVADLSIQDPNTTAIRKLNEKILKDERVWISMLPIGDGLTLALKK